MPINFVWKFRARFLYAGVLLCIATLAAAQTPAASQDCPRKFSDAQVDAILIEKLPARYAHTIEVNYVHCTYHAVLWVTGGAPDSEALIELDRDGNLPPEVVKYGYHGNATEDVSIRKAPLPNYPPRARAANITGSVWVRATVVPDSTQAYPSASIGDARVVRVFPPAANALTEGLIDALRTWKFNPRLRYGNAVPREVLMRFRFLIDGKTEGAAESMEVPDGVYALEGVDIKG